MPTLTPVDHDPFAEEESAGADQTSSKLTPVDHDPFAGESDDTEPEVQKDDSFLGGMKRGFLERGLGVDQLLNQIGVGGMVPVFTNGKLSFGLPPNEELARRQEILEKEGEGTGVKGFVSELAGDPTNLMPGPAKAGMFVKGALQSALSAFTAPTTDKDQTLGGRATNTAIAAPIGGATGWGIGKAGEKIIGKSVPAGDKMTDPSELYKAANQMGLKFTGKEKPQEIWSKIQTALQDRTTELAEKASPGSSTSRMWEVNTNIATSKMYGAAVAKNNALYEKSKELGAKEFAPVEGIANDIKEVIDHMEKKAPNELVNPKFGSTLNTLKDLYEEILSGGSFVGKEDPMVQMSRMLSGQDGKATATISGNQLVDLDQALNENFGRTGWKGSSGRALNQLQEKVQGAIKNMSPEFANSYQAAKNDFRQNIVQNFRENPVLAKYWKEEDFYAHEALVKGITLPPALETRVRGMLDRVESYGDLAELGKRLDPETYNAVRGYKFIQLMNNAGIDAAKISKENNYALLEKALENKPEDLVALDAIKTFAEQMNERGLVKAPTPDQLKKSDKLLDRAARTIFSFATGHKLYGLQHAFQTITGESPNAAQGKLLGIAKEVAKGTPKPVYKPGVIPKGITKGVATEEGKQVDDALEEGELVE